MGRRQAPMLAVANSPAAVVPFDGRYFSDSFFRISMNVDRYLQRIGPDREAVELADASALDRLQRAHVRPVPFENLCVVDDPTGDDRGEGELGEVAGHMTLLVSLDDPFVADVEFSDVVRGPLALERRCSRRSTAVWRVVGSDRPDADREVQFRAPDADQWEPRYGFAETPRDGVLRGASRLPRVRSRGAVHRRLRRLDGDRPRPEASLANVAPVTEDRRKRKRSVGAGEWTAVLEREFGVALASRCRSPSGKAKTLVVDARSVNYSPPLRRTTRRVCDGPRSHVRGPPTKSVRRRRGSGSV